MKISRTTRITVAAAVAVMAPLGLALPAQATTPLHDGCQLTAQAPYFAGSYTAGNVPEVYYEYDLFCLPAPNAAAFSVKVKLETYEQDRQGRAGDIDANGVDNADEDYIGQNTKTVNFSALGGFQTIRIKGVLPHTDTDANEEVWHKDRFQVTSGAVTGTWSAWDLSQPTQIWW